jgi:hypothetical protein
MMIDLTTFQRGRLHAAALGLVLLLPLAAQAQDEDIQKQLSNPIASLTLGPSPSVFDFVMGRARVGS